MIWSDYWGALSSRQRLGLGAGAVLIVAATIGLVAWLLRDPYVVLATGLGGEQVNELGRQLDSAKLNYRVGDGADAIWVARSDLGKARAAAAGAPFDIPPDVGLELFKETDFSSTDFAQRINYQRALQGELTRTIQTIAGVHSARVHVILADGGVFKRNAARASAAVSLAMQPGQALTRAQVRGIQRLVTASVPEIRIDDVVVLDDTGTSLTRAAADTEGDLSSAQLDLKRQADQYLESKLTRLLQEIVPDGIAALAVDTTLDDKQLRVTTDEPIATQGPRDSAHATGVLVKERQSQRGHAPGVLQVDGYAADADNTDVEYEYKVGNRLEQVLSVPGSIRRISVAVALQGAPAGLSTGAIEDLVAHAVGIDRSRGDSVAVLLLPGAPATVDPAPTPLPRPEVVRAAPTQRVWIAGGVVLIALLLVSWWARPRSKPADFDVVVQKVRQWLNENPDRDRG